jgi:hypothetical protein
LYNPEGSNGFGLHRFLDGRIAREIARSIRRQGLEARVTPALVCLVFIKTLFPKMYANEKRLLKAMRRLLPIFEREMKAVRREQPREVLRARELRLM